MPRTKKQMEFASKTPWQALNFLGVRTQGDDKTVDLAMPCGDDLERNLFCCLLALENKSLHGRFLGFLFSWLQVHGGLVFVDKLNKLYDNYFRTTGRKCPWMPVAAYFCVDAGHQKWRKLAVAGTGEPLLDPDDTAFRLKRDGLARFLTRENRLSLPENFCRLRVDDILPTQDLVRRNRQVRLRHGYGNNLRAEAKFLRDQGEFSPSALAEFAQCSYERARVISREMDLFDATAL